MWKRERNNIKLFIRYLWQFSNSTDANNWIHLFVLTFTSYKIIFLQKVFRQNFTLFKEYFPQLLQKLRSYLSAMTTQLLKDSLRRNVASNRIFVFLIFPAVNPSERFAVFDIQIPNSEMQNAKYKLQNT